MKWILLLVTLYLAYYTGMYGIMVWKEKNKFASVFVFLLALSLIGFQLYNNMK